MKDLTNAETYLNIKIDSGKIDENIFNKTKAFVAEIKELECGITASFASNASHPKASNTKPSPYFNIKIDSGKISANIFEIIKRFIAEIKGLDCGVETSLSID